LYYFSFGNFQIEITHSYKYNQRLILLTRNVSRCSGSWAVLWAWGRIRVWDWWKRNSYAAGTRLAFSTHTKCAHRVQLLAPTECSCMQRMRTHAHIHI